MVDSGIAMPELASEASWNERFHHWFVRYNPLYLASALFVLVGFFLVGLGLEEAGRPEARVDLTWVIEVYQVLLIAGAALLLRGAGQRRPAVMLALLEAVFLVDATFQTDVLALYEKRWEALVWLLWGLVKLAALAWAMRLRLRGAIVAVPILCLTGIGLGPQLLDLGLTDRSTSYLLTSWFTSLVIGVAAFVRPSVIVDLDLDAWDQTVLERSLKAVLSLWPAVLVMHLVAWAVVFDVGFHWEHFAPFVFLAALRAKSEQVTWAAAGLTILLSSGLPPTVAPVACGTALAFAWRGLREGQSRYWVAAILAGHVAVRALGWAKGPLPDTTLWLAAVTGAALVTLGWRCRQPLAFLVTALALLPWVRRLMTLKLLGSGIVFLVLGFASLVAGVWYNWTHRRHDLSAGDRPEPRRGR